MYKQYSARLFNIYGGIAQLGERLNGIQEVSGSIPLISTIRWCAEYSFLLDLPLGRFFCYVGANRGPLAFLIIAAKGGYAAFTAA